MGVSLSQWRFNIGTFNVISLKRKFLTFRNQSHFIDYISQILRSLAVTLALRVFFGAFLILAYCFMVIFLLPLCLILYPFTKFSYDISAPHDYPVVTYFAFLISIISSFPYRVRVLIRNTPRFSRVTFLKMW